MALNVECPGCLTPFALPEEQRGQPFRCATCQHVFVVGAAAEEAPRVVQPVDAGAAEAPKMVQLIDEEPYVAMPVDPKTLSRGRAAGKGPGPSRKPSGKKKLGGERVALLVTALIAVLTVGGAAAAIGYRVWFDAGKKETQTWKPVTKVENEVRPRGIVIQPFAKRIRLECEARDVVEILFSDEATKQAAVIVAPNEQGPQLEVYDLEGGQRLSSCRLDARALGNKLLSLSPGGTRFAYEDDQNNVIIISTKNGVEAARWRPYVPRRLPARGIAPPEQVLARLDFVAEDRLLTINQPGDLDLWTVPGLQPIYHVAARRERELTDPLLNDPRLGLTLSPDRKTVAVFNGDGFNVHNTADGQLVVKTAPVGKFKMLHSVRAAAFSDDGKSLAAVLTVWSGRPVAEQALVSWDAAKGRIVGDASLPDVTSREINTLAWWGSNYVMASRSGEGQGHLIAFPSGPNDRRVQIGYRLQFGRLAPNRADGRLWYVADPKDSRDAFLTAVAPPEDLLRAPADRPNETWWLTPDGIVK